MITQLNFLKGILCVLIYGFFFVSVITAEIQAQEATIDSLVNAGIAEHDAGNFDKAIEIYLQALEIDPDSKLANYEISFSYFMIRDYEKAKNYSGKALNGEAELHLAASIIHGSAFDELGETQQAIQVYQNALELFPEHFLLNYNIAVSYTRLNQLDNAEFHLTTGIAENPLHASSHLLLSEVMMKKGSNIQAIYPFYFFLLIEPETERAVEAYSMMKGLISEGIQADAENSSTINVEISSLSDTVSTWSSMNVLIKFAAVSAFKDSAKGINFESMEGLVEFNDTLFGALSEKASKNDAEDIWWQFYVPFFGEIQKLDFTRTFTYYVSMYKSEEADTWLDSNEAALDDFFAWLQQE